MDIQFENANTAQGARDAIRQMGQTFGTSSGRIIFSRDASNQITGVSRSSTFLSAVKSIFSADYRAQLRTAENDLNELLRTANEEGDIGNLQVENLRKQHYRVTTITGLDFSPERRGIADRVTPGLVVLAHKMIGEREKHIFSDEVMRPSNGQQSKLIQHSFHQAMNAYNKSLKTPLTEAEMNLATALWSADTEDKRSAAIFHFFGAPEFEHSSHEARMRGVSRAEEAVTWARELPEMAEKIRRPKNDNAVSTQEVEKHRAAGNEEATTFIESCASDQNKLEKLKLRLSTYESMRENAQRAAEKPGYQYKRNRWQQKPMRTLNPVLELARLEEAISVMKAEIHEGHSNSDADDSQ